MGHKPVLFQWGTSSHTTFPGREGTIQDGTFVGWKRLAAATTRCSMSLVASSCTGGGCPYASHLLPHRLRVRNTDPSTGARPWCTVWHEGFPKINIFKSRLKFVRHDLSRLKNKHKFAHHSLRVSLCILPWFFLIKLETLDAKSQKTRTDPYPTKCQSIRRIAWSGELCLCVSDWQYEQSKIWRTFSPHTTSCWGSLKKPWLGVPTASTNRIKRPTLSAGLQAKLRSWTSKSISSEALIKGVPWSFSVHPSTRGVPCKAF